jgi:hypothetical protein
MHLQYLIFDASDDGEGNGSWEAMASVRPDELSAVMAEVRAVEAAAQSDAPGRRGALDDGGVWDLDVQTLPDGDDRVSLTLTLTGPWQWGDDLIGRLTDP